MQVLVRQCTASALRASCVVLLLCGYLLMRCRLLPSVKGSSVDEGGVVVELHGAVGNG